MHKLVDKLIAVSLRNHVLILFLTAVMAVLGVISFSNAKVDAYPDVTNTRVDIIAQWPGRSAEEIDRKSVV